MFNGNTFQDFAALDDILARVDFSTTAASFTDEAVRRYYEFFTATYGEDAPGKYDLILTLTRNYIAAAQAHARTLQTIMIESLATICPPPPAPYRKAKISHELRRHIFERDSYRCKHCGDWHDLAVDHIYPERLGGALHPDNLQTLCRSCNSRKGARV